MPVEMLTALLTYALVMSMTPGPNNIMLLASGVNYGFRRTVPHMLGIAAGFVAMSALVGAGLGQALIAHAGLYTALKYASLAYIAWLAWRIATSGPVRSDASNPDARPMTFLEAAAFQWLNPKGWAATLTTFALYTVADRFWESYAIVLAALALATVPAVTTWTAFGVALANFLSDPVRLRVFNIAMALLLLASMAPIALDLMGSSP